MNEYAEIARPIKVDDRPLWLRVGTLEERVHQLEAQLERMVEHMHRLSVQILPEAEQTR